VTAETSRLFQFLIRGNRRARLQKFPHFIACTQSAITLNMHMVSIALRYTPGHPPCDPHHCCSLALAAAMTF
jgi:hypothetical protein